MTYTDVHLQLADNVIDELRSRGFLKPKEPLNAAIARLIVTVIRADIRAMPAQALAQAQSEAEPHHPPADPRDARRKPRSLIGNPVLWFAEAGTPRSCGRTKTLPDHPDAPICYNHRAKCYNPTMTGRPRDENPSKATLQKRRQRARKVAAEVDALSREERRRQMFEEAECVFRRREPVRQPPPPIEPPPLRTTHYTRSPTLNLGDDKT